MTFRLHSRLITWNLLIIVLVSFILAFFVSASQVVWIGMVSIVLTFIFAYGVHALVSRPLHEVADASRKLAAGDLEQRLPITGDEEIATLGTSLNRMAQNFARQIHELADGKQRLEHILEAMGEGVMVLDRSGRVTLTNTSLRRILETTRDLTGKTPLEIFRRPELENAVHEILRAGPAHVVEIPAAANRILQANVAPVPGGSGGIESVVVVFHDLTDIRRVERMRRDFVANVSHEFKTPLTSIRGYAETLMSGAKDDPQIAFDFLRTIERNAQHLEILVSDLLTLARLEAEVPSTKEQIELRPLIEEQIASRMNPLQDRGVHVTIDCPDIEIHADRARLSTALSNLLDNAIYYNKPGGQISISAEVQDRTLRLAVADAGQGIPSEELPRIFERFYRVDKARTRDSGGTGLGLSIVKHAIESQGGTINVTSRLGAGSTFTIRLPI
jgi:two-component system, OmpR family, phosphate regulon sensor histidine kinase PhoR